MQPIEPAARDESMDVLRGVAILGIFVMNSRNFAFPLQQFDNPAFPAGGAATTTNAIVWAIENLLFEDKMIAILCMLFGAGIVMAAARATRPAILHYRRMFWLLILGLLHAFGLWYGDILNTYAICGMLIHPLRRFSAPMLVGIGIAVLAMSMWIRVAPRIEASLWPSSIPAVESFSDRIFSDAIKTEEAAYRGSYPDLFRWRARLNIAWHWYGCIDYNFWRCGGFMLIGMGIIRTLSSRSPASIHRACAIGGYCIGLLLTLAGMWPTLSRAFGHPIQLSPESRPMIGTLTWTLRQVGASGIAVGHVGVILLLCRVRVLQTPLRPLAFAGRAALSMYICQTLIAMLIFDGWAGGQWGKWTMSEVAILVASVWAAQLVAMTVWFRFFCNGPLEWLWRTLTYGHMLPMRK